jgi:hypothetical protein
VQPITGQHRYENGGSVSRGDRRLIYAGAGVLSLAYLGHDILGIPLPSGPVIEFAEHMSPVLFLWAGLYHARTRQP